MFSSLTTLLATLLLLTHHIPTITAQLTNETETAGISTTGNPVTAGRRSIDCGKSSHGLGTDRIPTKDCVNALLQMGIADQINLEPKPAIFQDGSCQVQIGSEGGYSGSTSWVAIHIAVNQIAGSCCGGNGDTIINGGTIVTGPRGELKVEIVTAKGGAVRAS